MTAKQHILLAVLFGVVAASQAVFGYGFVHHGQTATAGTFYLIAVVALGCSLRAWGRRNYYP